MRLPQNTLTEEGLLFFYRIILWVERNNNRHVKLPGWKDTIKRLKLLHINKPKQGTPFIKPTQLEKDTLYVPTAYSGYNVIKQLRNAFCHDSLRYDKRTNLYSIAPNKNVKIACSFSLAAIGEFVSAFLLSSGSAHGTMPTKGKKTQSARSKTSIKKSI